MEERINKIINKISFRNDIQVAIRLGIRNEGDFIEEWLQFYISIGFNNFIIYDDNSTDNTSNIINLYSKYVNIIHIKFDIIEKKARREFYQKTIKKYGHKYDYIFHIDIDEFLWIKDGFNIFDFLKNKLEKKLYVVMIPRINIGNKEYFNSCIGSKYQCLCYDEINFEEIKNNNKNKRFCCKSFINTNNSTYTKSVHLAEPVNNILTNEISTYEYNISFATKPYTYNIDKISECNYRLYHLYYRNKNILNKNSKKYRSHIGNLNRYKNNIEEKAVKKLNYKSVHFQKFFKKIFLFF